MEQQKNTLYLECNSGISGDMAVAALLDLGADKEVLKKALKSIPIHGFRIKISRVKKAGLDVCDFHVILDEAHENHDHDMAYLFGEGDAHAEEHGHGGKCAYTGEKVHGERHGYAEEHGHGGKHAYTGEQAHGERHGYTEEHGHGGKHAYAGEQAHGEGHGYAEGNGHGGKHVNAGEQNHSEKCESAGVHTYSTEAHIPAGEEQGHERRHNHHDHEYGHVHHGHAGHSHDHAHGDASNRHDHAHSHANNGHDHDHSHVSHGHDHDHSHVGNGYDHAHSDASHDHSHGHASHSHDHDHSHANDHTHSHEHRGLPEILHIIRRTHMTEGAREIAVRIFRILASAEAKAHGLPENEVHFHEVGAVDSIVDIISVAVCLDNLGITRCIVPGLCEGRGTIRCQHGIMSVPVPAVVNIVQAHQLKLSVTDIRGELVTPTGAAIVAAVKTADDLPKSFRIIKTGMGGGKRAYERPSILRAMLIENLDEPTGQNVDDQAEKADKNREYRGEGTEAEGKKAESKKDGDKNAEGKRDGDKRGGDRRAGETESVNENDISVKKDDSDGKDVIYKLESNIDDCSGEALGYVMDRLLEAGARDVHYMPVYMKKNRPAYQLNVICRKEQIPELENIIFAETTTIGIRRQRMERSVLPRRSMEIMTDLGGAVVKECRLPKDAGVRYYPEYDSIVKLCRISGKSYQEVYHLVLEQCKTGKNSGTKRAEKRNVKAHRFFGRVQR